MLTSVKGWRREVAGRALARSPAAIISMPAVAYISVLPLLSRLVPCRSLVISLLAQLCRLALGDQPGGQCGSDAVLLHDGDQLVVKDHVVASAALFSLSKLS